MGKIYFAGTTFKINLMKTNLDVKICTVNKNNFETSLFEHCQLYTRNQPCEVKFTL